MDCCWLWLLYKHRRKHRDSVEFLSITDFVLTKLFLVQTFESTSAGGNRSLFSMENLSCCFESITSKCQQNLRWCHLSSFSRASATNLISELVAISNDHSSEEKDRWNRVEIILFPNRLRLLKQSPMTSSLVRMTRCWNAPLSSLCLFDLRLHWQVARVVIRKYALQVTAMATSSTESKASNELYKWEG